MPQSSEQDMQGILHDLDIIESRISELGIPKEAVRKITAMLSEYADLREALIREREKQFHDAAYDFLAEHKQASNRLVDALSAYLRHFAVYVLTQAHALEQEHPDWGIAAIVDHIHPMPSKQQQEEEQ